MNDVYVSKYAEKKLIDYLCSSDFTVRSVSPGGRTDQAIDAHPDIYYCKMGVTEHPQLFKGDPREIGASYPENIRFNAVCLDKYFIHNIKNTSPALIREAQNLQLELINVKQGYTKCNCVVVDGHSIITSDQGIIGTLKKYPDIDVLPICQGFVSLDGFEYGFLGGASGRVGDEIIFNGNLSAHPDYDSIGRFIASRHLQLKFFPEYPLTDVGSILTDF